MARSDFTGEKYEYEDHEDVFIHLLSDTYSAEKQLTLHWQNSLEQHQTKN